MESATTTLHKNYKAGSLYHRDYIYIIWSKSMTCQVAQSIAFSQTNISTIIFSDLQAVQ